MILMSSASVDFLISREINVSNSPLKRKFLLGISLCFNLGLLAFFKYWDWLLETLYLGYNGNSIIDLRAFKHNTTIPAGISFYTFETISYTIDIYRRKFKPTNSFIDYLSFISFFPHLVAGPILRASDLLPQLTRFRKKVASRIVENGLFLVFWGLFKKIVFADNLGHLVSRSKEQLWVPGAGFILAFAFMFQVYCDFSAYSDIARGCAKFFGIKIRRNFLTPYFCINPVDAFRRWHITLSTWIRDYVYIPLSKRRQSVIRSAFNLILTMVLVGLWHGAGTFFILWGLYYGAMLVAYRIIPIDKYLIKYLGSCGKFLAIFIMFCLVVFSYTLFWSKTNKEFISIAKSFFEMRYFITNFNAIPVAFYQLFYGAIIFILPIILTDAVGFKYKREFVDMYKFASLPTKIMLYLIMFYGCLFFASRGVYDFIYFQF